MDTKLRNGLAAALLVGLSAAATAEDIDLYVGGAEALGIPPNVLIMLDNSANWNNASQQWPGGVPQGQSEVEAISQVVKELGADSAIGDVNVGLMMIEDNGSASGGNARFAVRSLADSYLTFSDLASHINIGGDDQSPQSSNYDTFMNDAFRYFNGFAAFGPLGRNRDYAGNDIYRYGTGGNSNSATTTKHPATRDNLGAYAYENSGTTTYTAPFEANAGCSRNFIIFIGNGYPRSAGALGDIKAAAELLNDPTVLTNQVITDLYDPTKAQIYTASQPRYADEWARFMKRYGVKSLVQNPDTSQYPEAYLYNGITTYTIDVCNAQCDVEQEKLLRSMAAVGGGKYFKATDKNAIVNAIKQIFMEVQAVNSVFTSATLPVSVNTQGTYENQVYMGMFRPDGAGRPRWYGNLKEYQFGVDRTTSPASLFLADKKGDPAILGTTGFITETATSFWSTQETPGFWAFAPTGAGKSFDAPDGPLVEKGGAAQRARQTFASGRNVYTYLGTNADLFNSVNAFNRDSVAVKSLLTDAKFGEVILSRSAGSLTVNATGSGLPFADGEAVIINAKAGASLGYDGTYVIRNASSTGFRFDIEAEQPATPATPLVAGGAITATGQSVGTSEQVALTVDYVGGKASAPVTFSYLTGDAITVADAAVPKNPFISSTGGLLTLTKGTETSQTLEFNLPPFSCTTISGQGAVSCGKTTVGTKKNTIATVRRSGRWLLFGLESVRDPSYLPNKQVTVNASDIAWFNRTFNIAGITSSNCGGLSLPANGFCADLGGGVVTLPAVNIAKATNSYQVTITRNGTTAKATYVGTPDSPFAAGTILSIAGAAQSQYNGAGKVVLASPAPTATEFYFSVALLPEVPVVGTFIASNGPNVSKEDLIDWVRGVDNAKDNVGKREDENVNGIFTDVRGSIHGDVLHSRPLVINYGSTGGGIQIFYGANDGMLRSLKGGTADSDGVEQWAFIPPEFIERDRLARLYANAPLISYPNTPSGITPTPEPRDYFWDGNIGVYQSPDGTATAKPSKTYIFPTARRGGRFMYGLDVSTPTTPKFLWRISNNDADYAELGYTWSEPRTFRVKGVDQSTGATVEKDVLVFGGGYDPAKDDLDDMLPAGSRTMGLGVFISDLTTGQKLAHVKPTTGTRYSFPAEVNGIDLNGDGFLDRIYAGDTGANLWRIDIDSTKVIADGTGWATMYHLANLGDVASNGGSDNRKFLYPPEIVPFVSADSNGISKLRVAILAGSGDREQPLPPMTTDPVTGDLVVDKTKLVNDQFFMVIDGDEAVDPGTTVTVSDLLNIDLSADSDVTTDGLQPTIYNISKLYPTTKGWRLDLVEPSGLAGEKVVNAPKVDAGVCYFATNVPKKIDRSKGICSNLGDARAYAVSPLSGAPAFDRDRTGTKTDGDYFLTFSTGGMAPTMTSGIVGIQNQNGGTEFFRFQIGSGGASSTENATADEKSSVGGGENTIDLKGPRSRVFWYFNAD